MVVVNGKVVSECAMKMKQGAMTTMMMVVVVMIRAHKD